MSDREQRSEVVRYWWHKSNESLEAAHREFCAGAYTFAVNRLYELEKVNNLISALFYIENSSSEEIQKALDQIVDIIVSEQDKTAVKRFVT